MGRKSMELAENVLGNVIGSLGPSRFAEALENATRDGALYECKNVDMDSCDEDAQEIWLEQIKRLRQVGLWLEEKQGIPDFAKSAETELSRDDKRSVLELKEDDHTVQPINVIESVVFNLSGRKIQIVRPNNSKKNTVVLRGSLVWFVDALRVEMIEDGPLVELFMFVAQCIAEKGVGVHYNDYVCLSTVKGRHVTAQNCGSIEEDEAPDSFEPCYETTVLEFERFVRSETGCQIRLDQSDDDEVVSIMGVTREFIERNLENMVRNDRNVAYLIAYLRDTLGQSVTTTCNMRHILRGEAGMPVASVSAKRRLDKTSAEALS